MKKALLVAAVSMLSFMSSSAWAADAAFDGFWAKFKDALNKNDKEAIASMTRLPYLLDEKKLDRKAFIAYTDKIFTKKTRNCLVKQKPVKDNNYYSAFCGDDIFCFEKVDGKYLFTEIGVND